jgi:hypothetical protein
MARIVAPHQDSPPGARMRAVAALCLALCGLGTGCEKGFAGGLAPDFSGTWDVTYDDSIQVEVQLGELELHEQLAESGGQLSFHDAGLADTLALEVDCTRNELVCPSEVWPRELSLKSPPGKLDHDGEQLVQPLEGRGNGRCSARPGSLITGEVMNVASAHAVRAEAVALSSGRVRMVLDAACFAPRSGLPAGAQVVLSTGFTAAKR